MDLALNNLQRLICQKTQQTKPNNLVFIWLPMKRKSDPGWFNVEVPSWKYKSPEGWVKKKLSMFLQEFLYYKL